MDHGESFTLEKGAGAIFGDLPCRLEPALRDALQNLKFENVERSVGPLLNSQQIAALIARRDSILKVCG